MKKFTQILGLIGLVVLGIGFLALLIGQKTNLFINAHLVVGGGLVLIGLLSNLAGFLDYFRKRAGRAYSGAILQMMILAVIVFLIGLISYQRDLMMDVTRDRLFALSEPTKKILKNLPGEVKITAYFPSEGFDQGRQLLKLYQGESKKVKLEIIDPDRHPELAEAKGINTYGTIVFDYQGQQTRITEPQEDRITNSLLRVSRKTSWVIYFITGHGEADPETEDKGGLSMFKKFLEDENFQVKKLQITSQGIPPEACLIVIAGPRMPYQPGEVEAIDHYLGKGGDAVFLLDPGVFSNLENMLIGYGIEPLPGIVIDQVQYLVGMDAMGLAPVANNFDQQSEITKTLKGKLAAFPRVRPLKIMGGAERPGKWTPLVYSSATSYEETDLETLFKYGRARQDPADHKGPLLLAASYQERIQPQAWEENFKGAQIRIAVVGSTFFMRNLALDVYSNYLLAINLFNWAAGEQSQAFIVPHTRKPSRIFITAGQTRIIFYSSVLIIPEILCVIGLALWWRRK